MMLEKTKKIYNKMFIASKAALWFTICGFVQKGISFITVPIFTRLLTTEQYGVVSIFYSWESIFIIFCTLNLFSGVFNNGMIKYENDRDGFLSSMQGLVSTLTLCMLLLYLLFFKKLSLWIEISRVLIIVMFMEILANSAFSFWSAKQRFEFKYRNMVILTLVVSVLSPLVAAVSVINTPDKFGADVRIISSACIVIVFYGIIYIINYIKGKNFFSKKYWIYALKFNIPLVPHYLSTLILSQSDRIMISKMIGMAEAGIYGLSHNLAMILNILTTSINNAFAPWIYQRLKEEKYRDISSVCNKLFLFVAVALAFMMAFSPEVISILAPSEYYDAVYVIPPLAISLYFMFMYQIFANVEFYFEKNKFIMLASIFSAGFNVFLNYIFIKELGYIAAGYTTLVCYVILGISHYIFSDKVAKKCIKDNIHLFDIKIVIGISCILMVFGLIMLLLYKNLLLRYGLILIMCMIFFIKRKDIYKFIVSIRR